MIIIKDKISQYSILIFLMTFICLSNTSLSFDIRKGMSAPWETLKLNQLTFGGKNNIQNIIGETRDIIKKFAQKMKLQNETLDYKENFIKMKIDHFAFDNDKMFSMRYLVKDKYFKKEDTKSPILFYCGNEGPINAFWDNSGFITETLASQFNGLVIFAEHRFFGKSFPIGDKQDYDITKNKYLTVEQAMADFVELIRYYKYINRLDKDFHSYPVIAFGGSYGGMLSSWSRMKFPHVYAGAVASSAPILLFEDIDKISNSFFRIPTETYKRYDENCPKSIRSGFQTLDSLKNITLYHNDILKEINEIFNICTPIKNITELNLLEGVIEDAIVTMAQYNYPYETSFMSKMPGYPVKVACEKIRNYTTKNKFSKLLIDYEQDKLSPLMSSSIQFTFNKFNQINPKMRDSLNYLKEAISVFFNSTGIQKCLDIGNNQNSTTVELNGWSFLACTSMIMPMEKNGVTDMFSPQKWDLEKFSRECKSQWNGDIRPQWAFNFFGGKNFQQEIKSYSNIIFTNGKMDPWLAGCPRGNSTDKVFIVEADSAHHLDLRHPHPNDPESIVEVRKLEVELIKKWILDH